MKSGMGVGNVVVKDDAESFNDYVENMKCEACHQVFFFTTHLGSEKLCMNCYLGKFGSEKTQEQYMVLDKDQRKGWEVPISPERIKKKDWKGKNGRNNTTIYCIRN